MSGNSETPSVPTCILLATDLSARSDRALDRSSQLAGEWQAKLVVLNVLDPVAMPDQALTWATGSANDEELTQAVHRQLSLDLSGLNIQTTIQTAHVADASSAIRDTAADIQAGLVVTGVSSREAVGRFLLGSTVERLARTLPQPLLVVRNRPRAPYRRPVVSSDFSDSSRHALQEAVRLFPDRELILYHAYEMPLSGLADHPSSSSRIRDIKRNEHRDFIEASRLPAHVIARPVIESGAVETSLTHYVRQHDIDLVVVGTHGRSGIMNLLLGSTAAKLLNWLPCDVLLIRDPRCSTT